MKKDDWKRRLALARRVGIDNITNEIRREKHYEESRSSEDTKNRDAIHEFIRKKVTEGKTKEDIVKRLNFIYGSRPEFAKYRPYFAIWVEDASKKRYQKETITEQNTSIKDEKEQGEER